MSLNKKRWRVTNVSADKKGYPRLLLNEALELALAGKRTEGLRERTLTDYKKMWRYFTEWLNDNYEDTYIDEITTEILRNYINYHRHVGRRTSRSDYRRNALLACYRERNTGVLADVPKRIC